jgi:hypothetical protein
MQVVDLDVRHILRARGNPLKLILQTVDELGTGRLLQLHTPFKPSPLYRVMARQGYLHTTLCLENGHFVTQFYSPAWGVNQFFIDPHKSDVDECSDPIRTLFDAAQGQSDPPTLVILTDENLDVHTAHLKDSLYDRSFICHVMKQGQRPAACILIRQEPQAARTDVNEKEAP